MHIRPTLAAPLPWLAGLARGLFGKDLRPKPWPWFILPRTLSFTREGRRFTILLLLIGMAAINTGNNLLYLIVAMMLSLIIVSGILSESTLRAIHIKRSLPNHIFAGKPVQGHWVIENKKRFIPSFSLVIEEMGQVAERGYYIKILAKASILRGPFYTFQRRGVYRLEGFRISTRFPFGLFLKARREAIPLEVIVYPKVRAPAQHLIRAGASSGELPERVKGIGTQLYNLREYTLGDDSRRIHWRSTAKTGRLIAKEFEREVKRKVMILLDNTVPPNPSKELLEGFEGLVEESASIAFHLIKEGLAVGLKTSGEEIPCNSGKRHLYRVLRCLALIRPVEGERTGGVRVMGA